jgi:starvation-inducible outer membrane lipoprotein
MKKILMLLTLVLSVYLTGCATVPMAPTADDQLRKQFSAPSEGKTGLYIYRCGWRGKRTDSGGTESVALGTGL